MAPVLAVALLGGVAAAPPPPDHRAVLVLEPLRLAYRLPHSFLEAGSDSVRIGARALMPGRDYVLDRDVGELRVLAPFAAGETLHVRYRALPLGLSPSYGLAPEWRLPAAPAAAAESAAALAPADTARPARPSVLFPGVATAPGAPAEGGGPQLRLSGNKSVAVELGQNRDAELRQSLDLSASGRLGPRTEVVALLSDRNASLDAAGGTLALGELDKLLVEIRAPAGAATLGDFSLLHEGGSFGSIRRELTGVRLRAGGERAGLSAGFAVEKGPRRSLDLYGQEGRQGPYLLTDEGGTAGVPLVAGSEVVWLDGERLTRGESADYAIDYARGRLTFTPRRPITVGSRIAVDYELAGSAYRRRAAQLAGQARRGGLSLFGHAFREGDESGHPQGRLLSPADYAALAAAGDSAGRALAPGVFAGPGDYDSVRTEGGGHLAYAGPAAGALRVDFVEVGTGAGAYAESTSVGGVPVFRFVGAGLGTHVPGRRLALPAASSLAGGGLRYELGTLLSFSAEGAASARDANVESSRGDADNRGSAGRAELVFSPRLRPGGRDWGALRLEGGWRGLDRRFVSPARADSAFFQEEWGASIRRALDGRSQRFAALTYRPRAGTAVSAERARLTAAGGFVSDRWRGTLQTEGRLSQRLRVDRVDAAADAAAGPRDGHRDRWLYDGRWEARPYLVPTFSLDHDERLSPGESESLAVRYRAWDAGLGGRAGSARWSAGFGFRRDFARTGGAWDVRQTARTLRLAGSASPSRLWSLSGGASRRWLERPGAGRSAVDNGFGRVRAGGRDGRLEQEVSAEWTSEVALARVREVLFVGQGAGAYDSLGNFVGRGDYTLRIAEDPRAATRLARAGLSYRLEARPLQAGGASGAQRWRALRVGTLLQSSAGRRGALRLADFLAHPGRLADDSTYATGSFLWRQEVETAPGGAFELLLRLERRGLASREYAGYASLQREWSEEVRARWRPDPRWLVQASARGAQRRGEQALGGGAPVGRRLEELTGGLEATWTRGPRLALTALASFERVAVPGGPAATVARFGPRALYSAGERLRAEAQARWAALSGGATPVLFPEGFPVRPDRLDFRLDLSYRVRQRTTLGLTWIGHDPAGGRFDQTARGELRAFFE